MDNNEYRLLDEALGFLNTGKINLTHSFKSNYDKLSHKAIEDKSSTGFFAFHNEILKVINKLANQYKLDCKLFDVYSDKLISNSRIATLVINKNNMKESEYNETVLRFRTQVGEANIMSKLNSVSKDKVKVTNVNFCYTKSYKVYSIDVYYNKIN